MTDIQLLHMDCMEYMAKQSDKAFDLAIVDPPYGIGMDNQCVRVKPTRPNTYTRAGEAQYKNANWDIASPDAAYFSELIRVSSNQIVWGANYFCGHLPSGKGWIYWDKQMGVGNGFSTGEFAFQSIETRSNSVSIPSMRVAGTRIHPTQKPVALYEWLLTNYAKPGQRILDTHLGSGSSAIAAYNLGFDFVGMELDEDYYKAAVERFNKHKAQGRMFDEPVEIKQVEQKVIEW